MHNKLNRLHPSISLDVPQHHLSIVFLTAGVKRSLLARTYTSHNINLVQGANRPQSNPPISQPANQSITSTREPPPSAFSGRHTPTGIEKRGRGRAVSFSCRASLSQRTLEKAPHPKGSSRLLLRALSPPPPSPFREGSCVVVLTQRGADRSGEGWFSVPSQGGRTRWLFDVARRGGVVCCGVIWCCVVLYMRRWPGRLDQTGFLPGLSSI